MSPTDSVQRYHAFDSLRAAMLLVVVVSHAMLPYVTIPWFYEDPSTHIAFDVVTAFLYSFIVQTFLVVAGFFGALLYERRAAGGLIRDRFQRVFLPLVAAYFLITPLVSASFDFAVAARATGSVGQAFASLGEWGWLRLESVHHLWFLLALTMFYPLALGIERWSARSPGRFAPVARATRAALASPWRPAFFALLGAALFVPALMIRSRGLQFPFLASGLFSLFGLGWLLYRWAELLPQLARRPWAPLPFAAVVLAPYVWAMRRTFLDVPVGIAAPIAAVCGSVVMGCMVFSLLGLFLRYGDRPSPVTRYASEASYWIYLVHYPLVIFLGGALIPVDLPSGVKFLIVNAVSIPLLFASYHLLVRHTFIGVFLHGKRRERPRRMAVPQPR